MDEPFYKDPANKDIKITVIGGGTGSFTILSALKNHTKQLAAVVNMSDDGGSTGVLRDELGTLPPGDVRQCLVALSDSLKIRDLFDYRFEEGTLQGHSFGNILLTALEKVTGSFSEAVKTASEILRVHGTVIPATLDDVRLKMKWPKQNLELKGESIIALNHFRYNPKVAELSLTPNPKPNPIALDAIIKADIVIIAPGDLYASLGPLLIIDGVGEALAKTKALKIYVANLVTKNGQTTGFTVSDHAKEIERFAGVKFLDFVLYNNAKPTDNIMSRYIEEKAYLTEINTKELDNVHFRTIGGNFLGKMATRKKSDVLLTSRSLIRHDAEVLARSIMDVYGDSKN